MKFLFFSFALAQLHMEGWVGNGRVDLREKNLLVRKVEVEKLNYFSWPSGNGLREEEKTLFNSSR
jgi:hypothetical protein